MKTAMTGRSTAAVVAAAIAAAPVAALEGYVLDRIIPLTNSYVQYSDVCCGTNGMLYCLGSYSAPCVVKVTSAGAFSGRWGDATLFNSPSSVDIRPDENLQIAASMQGPILLCTPEGTVLQSWGTMGFTPGQLMNVVDLAVNPDDNHVFVIDMPMGNHRIQEFEPDGTFLNLIPLGIRANSIGTDGTNLYVAGMMGIVGVVARMTLSGEDLMIVYSTNAVSCQHVTLKPGGLLSFGLMGGGESNLFVCDRSGSNLVEYSANESLGRHAYDASGNLYPLYAGDSVAGFGGVTNLLWDYGRSMPDALASPYELSRRPDGQLYVAEDSWLARNYLRTYSNGVAVSAVRTAIRAVGLGVGMSNAAVLSDASWPYMLSVIFPDGTGWDITNTVPSVSFQPGRLDADQDRIYVANYGRVLQMDYTGVVYMTYAVTGTAVDVRLISPTNIAVLHHTNITVFSTLTNESERMCALPPDSGVGQSLGYDGSNFLVATSYGKVVKCSDQGTMLAQFGSYGSQPGQFIDPTGLELDESGKVWVCDQPDNRIQVFRRARGVVYQSHSLSNGDNDFAIEPYEDIWLSVAAMNALGAPASNVVGTLSSSSPYLTILSNTVLFGTMADNALVTNGGYHLVLATNAPNNARIMVQLVFSADNAEPTTNQFSFVVSYSFSAGGMVEFAGAPTNATVYYAVRPFAQWNWGATTTSQFLITPGTQPNTYAFKATAPGYDDSAWVFGTMPPNITGIVLRLGDADIVMPPVDIVLTAIVNTTVSTGFWISSLGSAPLNLVITDTAGGYGYVDNRVPSGPAFLWKDWDPSWHFFTNGFGDVSDYPAEPPFDIGVYDTVRTAEWASINGLVALQHSPFLPSQGQTMPYAWAMPGDKDVAAPYWADQLLWWNGLSGTVAWITEGATCQWTTWESVQTTAPPATNSYQMAQYANGDLLFQYKELGDPHAEASIGIQNKTAAKGLNIQDDELYVTNNTAVLIYRDATSADWLAVSNATEVATGAQVFVTLDIDGTRLLSGIWHRAAVVVRHNDGDVPIQVGQVRVYGDVPEPGAVVLALAGMFRFVRRLGHAARMRYRRTSERRSVVTHNGLARSSP